jgi:hypothetical protein
LSAICNTNILGVAAYWQIRHLLASLSSSHLTMFCSSSRFRFSSADPGAAAADLRPLHTSRGFRASSAPSIDSRDRRDEAERGSGAGFGSEAEVREAMELEADSVGTWVVGLKCKSTSCIGSAPYATEKMSLAYLCPSPTKSALFLFPLHTCFPSLFCKLPSPVISHSCWLKANLIWHTSSSWRSVTSSVRSGSRDRWCL